MSESASHLIGGEGRSSAAAAEETFTFDGREVLLRPARAEDRARHEEFHARVEPHDLRLRFFGAVRELPQSVLERLVQMDHHRAMAFVAIGQTASGMLETLAVAQMHAEPNNEAAELGLLVRSDLKGRGLGTVLLEKLIRYCRSSGIHRLNADVLADNTRMLRLARRHGFRFVAAGQGTVRIVLDLH